MKQRRRLIYRGDERTSALRAPTALLVRIKNTRTKNAVTDKSNTGLDFFCKIADCVRTAVRLCAIGDPSGLLLVRATSHFRKIAGAIQVAAYG